MNISDDILKLITLHLSQKSSGEGDSTLEQWLKASPENRAEFEKIRKIWETSGSVVESPIDVQMEWSQFKDKHFDQSTSKTKVIPLNLSRILTYAAAAVVLLGVFVGVQHYYSSEIYSTESGQRLLVSLEDGTEVILSENSTLTVSSSFNNNKREVELKGEGFFTVAKNPSKPFEITGPKTTTRILGTAFQLRANAQSNYLNVSEGKVAYWETDNKDTLILTRGERGEIESGKLIESTIANPNFDSWKTGDFVFENKQVADVLYELQNHYLFDAPNLAEFYELPCHFSGKFNNQNLEDALEEFALIMGMDYSFEGASLNIKGFNCN